MRGIGLFLKTDLSPNSGEDDAIGPLSMALINRVKPSKQMLMAILETINYSLSIADFISE